MISKKGILSFLNTNKWIIAASIFFIVFKFTLITILWHERLSPPMPDDSYVYITHIELFRQCPSVFFCENTLISQDQPLYFSHITYGVVLSILSRILGITSEQVFHLSFYLGTLILVPILIMFIKSFSSNEKLTAFSLFFLALFNGGGSYHGFFWVVPSFFALMFFFIIFSIFIGNYKYWKVLLTILIPAAIYTHMIAFYLLFVIFIFLALKSALDRKVDKLLLKKAAFIFIIIVISYFALSTFFTLKSFSGNHNGVETFAKNLVKVKRITPTSYSESNTPNTYVFSISKDKVLNIFSDFEKTKNNYLKWIFLNPIGLFSMIFIVYILYQNKQGNILLLYSSSLIFIFFSSIFEYGYRSLILIWPITFLLYAFGIWFMFNPNEEIFKNFNFSKFSKIFIILGIFAFAIINIAYSLFWNQYSNQNKNYKINFEFVNYLKQAVKKNELVMYDSKIFKSITALSQLNKIRKSSSLESSSYYLTLKPRNLEYGNSQLNKLVEIVSRLLLVKRQGSNISNFSNEQKIILKENFYIIKTFGDIEIYKKND